MHKRSALVWTGIPVGAFLAYLPALRAGWVFDDAWNIVNAPSIHWTRLSTEKLDQLLTLTPNPRRVVSNLSFALNHMAGGLDPRGYHLVNVLIHLGVGLALAWLITLYLRDRRNGLPVPVHLLAVAAPVALFLLHPVNTQAVTYVVQRMTSLAALFALLSFAAYLKGRQATSRSSSGAWFGGAFVLWGLGMASKEIVVALPLVVLTWELSCGGLSEGRLVEAWRRWSLPRRALALAGVLVIVSAVTAIGVRFLGTPASWLHTYNARDFSGVERVLTQGRVGILYLSLLVWPSPGRLNLDHDFSVSRGLLDPPSTLAAGTFWVVAVFGAILLTRRRPLLGFPILAYLECHLIEAGPVNLELVFEHRLYLPLAMLSLLPAAVLAGLRPSRIRATATVATALVLALGWATFVRNSLWADPVAFHQDISMKSPNKPRAHRFLAEALVSAGRAEEAIAPALRAVELDPTDYQSLTRLGVVYHAAGRLDDALAAYRNAVAVNPTPFPALFQVGVVLAELGRREEALAHFTEVGTKLGMQGQSFQAIPYFEEAVSLAPESSTVHNQLGNVYGMEGRLDDALREYTTAVSLDGTNVEAVYNLANVLELQGRVEEAIPYYRHFLEIAPETLDGAVRAVRAKLGAIEAAASRPDTTGVR